LLTGSGTGWVVLGALHGRCTMSDQNADLTGWYWHPGAQQPVYLFWDAVSWQARWYNPPDSGNPTQDEPLTPGLLRDLIPLDAERHHEQHLGE
jgi:hypothetical protein